MLTAARSFLDIFKTNVREFRRSMAMAKVELNKRYSGSLLGVAWAVVKPAIFVGVYWFAISVGIRGGKPVDGIPYFLWLVPGIFPWFFISDSLTTGGASIRAQRHLVTKMVFPVSTIPVFTVLSLFAIHLVLMALTVVIFVASGYGLTLYTLQIAYYIVCAFALAVVLATLLSVLTVVSRDVEHLVKSTVQVLFWLTPIIWFLKPLHGTLRKIIMLNPITYIVEGYRNAFVYERWFFEQPVYSAYFWAFLIALTLLTSYLYEKLHGEFADVL